MQRRRKKLAGSFIQKQEDNLDFDEGDKRDERDDVEMVDGEVYERMRPWNPRSVKQRAYWTDTERREKVLAKRRATLAAKNAMQMRKPVPKAKDMSEATQKRAEALRLRYANEEAWMRQRLDAGAAQRARLNNDDFKRERQAKRSEAMRRSHAARRRAAAPVTDTANAQ